MIRGYIMQVIVTNTIYETFLMFLLGYGLAQYPRHLWMQSNLDYYLLRTQMRASAAFKAIGESQLNVSLVVADVMKTKAEVLKSDVRLAMLLNFHCSVVSGI